MRSQGPAGPTGVLAALLVAATVTAAPAASAEAPPGGPDTTGVLVLWDENTPPATRRSILAGLGEVRATAPRVDTVEVATTDADATVRRLAARTEVVVAEVDRPVHLASTPPSDPLFREQWGLDNTGQLVGLDGRRSVIGMDARALEAWAVTRGSPEVTVALVDAGVDLTHPDLAGALWVNPREQADGNDTDGNGVVDDVHGYDAISGRGIAAADAVSLPGEVHGTLVASVLVARADDGVGMVGMAPGVRLMPVRAFEEDPLDPGAGQSSLETVIAGLAYAVANGADIINASWESASGSVLLEELVADAGVPVVAAAGNRALDLDLGGQAVPAGYRLPNLVAVTAIDAFGRLPAFATFGATTIDLGAPGVSIVGAMPGGGYADLTAGARQGTSFAVPFVSGALALGRSVDPGVSTTELIDTLLRTTVVTEDLLGRTTSGGRLDVAAFLAGLERPVCGGRVHASGFPDVPASSVHATALGCLGERGIAGGFPDGTYRPAGEVTRGQLAATLARVVDAAGLPIADAPPAFVDTAGTTHEAAFDVLAALGIVEGDAEGRARPSEPVTRGQAAALLVRTHAVLDGQLRTPTRVWFTDTPGTTHAAAIAVGRDLGLVVGRDRVGFAPEVGIRRDQMASVLARLLDSLAREGVVIEVPAEETGTG